MELSLFGGMSEEQMRQLCDLLVAARSSAEE
jgi:hypothetical protein